MALKAFWQLETPIEQIRHMVVVASGVEYVEDTYQDVNGDRAIIARYNKGGMNTCEAVNAVALPVV